MNKTTLKSEQDYADWIGSLTGQYNPVAVRNSSITPPDTYPCVAVYYAQDIEGYGGWSINYTYTYISDLA